MTSRTSPSVAPAWTVAWSGGALIGVANGVAREATYGRRTTENVGNQISGATGVIAFASYFWLLQRRWPIGSEREAVGIGAIWLTLTVVFEFTFGRRVAKRSWTELVGNYNLRRGRTWPLVLAWIAAGPAVIRRVQRRLSTT